MVNKYIEVYDSEVFTQSKCIQHENRITDFFRSTFEMLGYKSVHESDKIYQKNNRKAVVCLVDDVFTVSRFKHDESPYLFDPSTTVISDTFVCTPTVYKLRRLPDSFYGIYYYEPDARVWNPTKNFTYSVNRIDDKRIRLFLELSRTCGDMKLNNVNFNCWHWSSPNQTTEDFQQNFTNSFNSLGDSTRALFQDFFEYYLPQMPLRNYEGDLETAHVGSWLNIIVETYSSDTTIAFSEKVFRALVTPAPWMLWAGRNAIAHLQSLGFDTVPDYMDLYYDRLSELETDNKHESKFVQFVNIAKNMVEHLQTLPFDQLSERFKQAAEHNQRILKEMKDRWPSDFAEWLPDIIEQIK